MHKIVLMSHGELALAFLKAARMIVGNTGGISTVSMAADDGIEGTMRKLDAALKGISDSDDIIILVDLYGGTPYNVANLKATENSKIKILSGLNLPILIECILNEEKPNLFEYLTQISQESIKVSGPQEGESPSDDDE